MNLLTTSGEAFCRFVFALVVQSTHDSDPGKCLLPSWTLSLTQNTAEIEGPPLLTTVTRRSSTEALLLGPGGTGVEGSSGENRRYSMYRQRVCNCL